MDFHENDLAGFLLINKPAGMSSFACVAHIKKILGKKIKIGHAGTLDPFATGLLIVGINRIATKHLSALMKLDKIYNATGKLGEQTDTLDKTGTIIKECDTQKVTTQVLQNAIDSFGSEYEQTPPLYSALKHEGQPLYKLVRKQKIDTEKLESIAQNKKRTVKLHELELLDCELPFFSIKAHVSHGTYIRSLVNDIAQKINNCATTYELERSAIGPFDLVNTAPLGEIKTIDDITNNLITTESTLEKIESYCLE